MVKMQVMNYDHSVQKYEVKIIGTGERIHVSRLQIIFNHEQLDANINSSNANKDNKTVSQG